MQLNPRRAAWHYAAWIEMRKYIELAYKRLATAYIEQGLYSAYSLHKARCLDYLRAKASHDQLESQGTPTYKAKSA